MLKYIAVLVLLAISVQGRDLLQVDDRPRVMLTVDSPTKTGSEMIEFTVTTDKCTTTPDIADFRFFPASAVDLSSATVESTFDNQQWVVKFKPVSGHASSVRIVVMLPEAKISVIGGAAMNYESNQLSVNVVWELGAGVLSTVPNTVQISGTTIVYKYAFAGHRVYPTPATLSLLDISVSNGGDCTVESVEYTPFAWYLQVKCPPSTQVTATFGDDAAVDALGQYSDISNVVVRNLFQPSPDCIVTEWTEFDDCSEPCTGYDATFNLFAGKQTRTRSILQQALPEGIQCPTDLVETRACNERLCFKGLQASRPFSGETSRDCSAGPVSTSRCSAVNPKILITAESNGCSCADDCLENEDCCQGWFSNNCCEEGEDCENIYSEYVYTKQFPDNAFPKSCTRSNCGGGNVLLHEDGDSYYCWCDAQCTNLFDNSCCGGNVARNAVCQS